MTLLDQWSLPAVQIPGTPAPKGSLMLRQLWKGGRLVPCRKCGTKMDTGRTILVEDNKRTKPWRKQVAAAGGLLREAAGGTIQGPVGIDITFTLTRPDSVTPGRRTWPHVRGSNDIDKLARCLLDGLQDAQLFADDSQVCELVARKAYPDSPSPDALDKPGAIVRIYPI
jgi:Holliday junction resolvase RusA-like endonuclease